MKGERRRRTKADTVADQLREAIASGVIAQGTRLHQDELAVEFSTSITPVREALRQLEAEGLLLGERHRGASVARPDIDQIASIYVMRRLLEPYAARRSAVRLTRRDFDRARRVNESLADVQIPGGELIVRKLNHDFHFVFYQACGLPTLAGEIERLWATFPWAGLQLRRRRNRASVSEHAHMLEAIIDNDQAEIQRRFESHIHGGYLALMEHLGSSAVDDPFDLDTAGSSDATPDHSTDNGSSPQQ